jgi:hypothetical protein
VDESQSEENSEKKDSGQEDEEILSTARRRFAQGLDFESEIRALEIKDEKFAIGEQWDSEDLASRSEDDRPCLVINKLPEKIRTVTNELRQNRPSIKVSPVDDVADPETAKVMQGLIRHIEYNSDADVAYDTAADGAVRKGRGYWRIVPDYAESKSFDQELFIKRILNSKCVLLDPARQKPDGSDSNWGFVFEDMPADEFKAQYPEAKLTQSADWNSIGDELGDWVKRDTVRVAEYFYKSFRRTTIVLLSTGESFEQDQIPKKKTAEGRDVFELPEGVRVVQTRETVCPDIKWCKINGFEVLDKSDIPIEWIPIVECLGEEQIVDSKRHYSGIVRHAIDSQKMYNLMKSSEIEIIAQAPRVPYVGAAGQFEGHEGKWQAANKKAHAFLQYNPIDVNGVPVPPPQRNSFEPAIQAVSYSAQGAAEDLKSVTGVHDSAVGARSNESSGVAIQRRAVQSQTNNFHYSDNVRRSIRHTGRILLAWIPHIYDSARTIRILGEGDTSSTVKINEQTEVNGKPFTHKMNVGKYDVTVDVGPSFQTKRQEAVASMLEYAKADPQALPAFRDLMASNMDWPYNKEIAERLKKIAPPGLIEEKDPRKQQIPPQFKAQMDQLMQQHELLTKEVEEQAEIIKTKRMEIESRERIENLKVQANLEIEMAKLGSSEAIELLRTEIAQIEQRMNLLNQNQPITEPDSGVMSSEGVGAPAEESGSPSFEQPNFENEQPTGGFPPG